MSGWNLADMWECVADEQGDALAQIHGDRRYRWSDFDHRADGVAHALLARGIGHQDKVAIYLYNTNEYLETVFACAKVSLVPVNTNYRYTDDELVYLWNNADATAVIFQGCFTGIIERIRERVGVHTWLWVDDGSGSRPDWATDFEQAATTPTTRAQSPQGRSGDDLYFLYTGGTTGYPKGVMWRQDDVIMLLDRASKVRLPDEVDFDALRAKLLPGLVGIPAAPLMHGTGGFNSFSVLMVGGAVATLEGRSFDPVEVLDTIERERAKSLSIVGDAMARPLLRALDAQSDRWDISSLRVITSSGVMWAAETKAGLLRHNPRLTLVDSLGSSEAITMGASTSTAGGTEATARFRISDSTRVLTEDGREVQPGSAERGRLALKGRIPVGYYKDEIKTAATFVTVAGQRFSIPGDWATVDADGTVVLLGRGSQCINTGGEKVYPEEVEEALKLHPSVHDAAVVGVPDERFGQAITAVVQLEPGSACSEADLIAHIKARLASYKAPRHVLVVDALGRQANGKLDYQRHAEFARRSLGL